MNEMDTIIKEFIVESNENLDQLDRDLVQLEREPASRELLGRIFRTVHSIKGATGFLGFGKLGGVAHAGENLLSQLRDEKLVVTPAITTGLLSLVDAIRGMLSQIAESGTEGNGDYTRLVETLTHLQDVAHVGKDPPAGAPPESGITSQSAASGNSVEKCTVEVTPPKVTQKFADSSGGSPALEAREQEETQGGSFVSTTLRVNIQQLDSLMDLVGELVLVRNHVIEVASRPAAADFAAASQRLNSITSEMQQRIAKLRMQPINTVWRRFPRLVRDLAVQCGKRVRLAMHGEETELDKMILEMIQDPLTHLLRNAVDHGIESPEVRVANGKYEEGTLTLRAFHENGQVNIEISDDGGGIDAERVKEKALKTHLITAEMAAQLSSRDSLRLIFLPGLSTATDVTDVSGRGVGMDVVKSNIERIGGTLDVQTRKGAGTTIKIVIPLTLAIIPALLVVSRGECYAIPQASVAELVRLGDHVDGQSEHVGEASFYRLRSELLQFVSLEDGLRPNTPGSQPSRSEQAAAGRVMVVLQEQDRRFGLLVDEVNDTQEIVVRSIGKHLRNIPVYAGATILGDGRVALILNVSGLARRACTAPERESPVQLVQPRESSEHIVESEPLLIFEHREGQRFALPISGISRLARLPQSRIERAGARRLIRYDGDILPVFGISGGLSAVPTPDRGVNATGTTGENIDLVMCQHRGRSLALAVDHIVDIVNDGVTDLGGSRTQGDSAPRIIGGQVTTVLDLEELCMRASSAMSQSSLFSKDGERNA